MRYAILSLCGYRGSIVGVLLVVCVEAHGDDNSEKFYFTKDYHVYEVN